VGVRDRFGEVGPLEGLLERFELSGRHIAAAVRESLSGKG
jgi:transketolase C-terminal domain/subunit